MSLRSLVCCGWEAPTGTKFTIAKWFYCTLFTATATATWVLRDYAGEYLSDNISSFKYCRQAGVEHGVSAKRSCGGKEVALRVSFANLIFFSAHFLACFMLTREEDPRVDLHAGLWVWQVLSWVGLLIGFMWLPPDAMYGYAQFARYASGFFLVLQLLLLVNFVYEINEWLVQKDNGCAWSTLIGGAGLAFAGGLALVALCYHFYAPAASCSLNIFFATWTLVLGLALVGVLFIPGRAPTAGLLTTGLVWLYMAYLTYSALSSEPANRCMRNGGVSSGGWVSTVAFFIAIAAVIYSTIDAGTSSRDMFGSGRKHEGGLDEPELPYRPDFYHFVFMTASCYIAMLFTNWAVSGSTAAFELDRGWASTWVKIASAWTCALLYGWSVVAPAVLRDRDFGPPI